MEGTDVVDSLLRYMYGLKVPIFAAMWTPGAFTSSLVLQNIERLRVAAVKGCISPQGLTQKADHYQYEVTGLASAATEQLSDEMLGCKELCRDVSMLAIAKLGEKRQAGPFWWRAEDTATEKVEGQATKQIDGKVKKQIEAPQPPN